MCNEVLAVQRMQQEEMLVTIPWSTFTWHCIPAGFLHYPDLAVRENSACMRLSPQQQLGTAEMLPSCWRPLHCPKALCLLPVPRTTSGMFAFGAMAERKMFDL